MADEAKADAQRVAAGEAGHLQIGFVASAPYSSSRSSSSPFAAIIPASDWICSTSAIELRQRETSPYKFSVERNLPEINSPAATAHLAQSSVWPILEDIAMFSVDLTHQGMRELHWHPQTAEMGYITQGRGRMTIVSPGGSIDTFEMHPGDVYFIPAAYPHHFEDLGEDDLKLLVFFDQPLPGDIGMLPAASCFSKDVLAASLGLSPSQFPTSPLARTIRCSCQESTPSILRAGPEPKDGDGRRQFSLRITKRL